MSNNHHSLALVGIRAIRDPPGVCRVRGREILEESTWWGKVGDVSTRQSWTRSSNGGESCLDASNGAECQQSDAFQQECRHHGAHGTE